MTHPRAIALIAKLEKGRQKTLDFFNALTPEQWEMTVYQQPLWQVRHLLAHFVSAEQQLLALAQSIAAGGSGAPPDMDIDQINAEEQARLAEYSTQTLLELFDQARGKTVEWTKTIGPEQLDRIGRHPVLGEISVETMLESMYGHQLIHMRDLMRLINAGGNHAPEQ